MPRFDARSNPRGLLLLPPTSRRLSPCSAVLSQQRREEAGRRGLGAGMAPLLGGQLLVEVQGSGPGM